MRSNSLKSRQSIHQQRGYIIFFLLVMMPSLLVGTAFAADASRIIMASHQAGIVADNVVMAGATGMDDSNVSLDTRPDGLAVSRATQTFVAAKSFRMMPQQLHGSLRVVDLQPSQLTVSIDFEVRDLIIFGFFKSSTSMRGTATRSAGPCVSGEDSTSCAYLG